MKVTINYGGQLVSVEVSVEVYEFLDCADHKEENLAHEKRRHWDGREFDEHIVFTEGVGVFSELPEDYLCRKKRWTSCFRFWIAAPRHNAADFCSMRWTT